MSNLKYINDMLKVQQYWNDFIKLVKTDLNNLRNQQKEIIIEIKKIERIERILNMSQNNIDFIIAHKEIILNLDATLSQKFTILEAFKKRDNLENAVAIRTYKEIIQSESIKQSVENLKKLREKMDLVQESIDKINYLTTGEIYDKELIIELINKHNINGERKTALILYPIFKTLKKASPEVSKKEQKSSKESIVQTKEPIATPIPTPPIDEIEFFDLDEPELHDFKTDYELQKERYEKIKTEINLLLNKYYEILDKMSQVEFQYYKAFSMIDNKEENEKFEGNYDEAVSKTIAIRLFEDKKEIEKLLKSIVLNNYLNKEEIELLEEYINDFEELSKKLLNLEKNISKIEEETIEDSKVFFLLNSDMQPLVSSLIQERGYQGNLINIIKKAQEGHIQNKKGSNIMPLQIRDKKFKKECNRTVFTVRNTKIIVSYIKLNSELKNNEKIMILTVCPLNHNTIQEDTERIIRENTSQILNQIEKIEKNDPQMIEIQNAIRNEFLEMSNESLEEGELSGRKVK